MGVRYIGSKARLADVLAEVIGPPDGRGRFVDAFCGTGAVARAAALSGWDVRLNDHLSSSVTMATASLLARPMVPFNAHGGYEAAVEALNATRARRGFLTREYSPESLEHAGVERRYFTTANAGRLDGMRHQVAEWSRSSLITPAEESLLVADLLQAANAVANIAGTYGCFMKNWTVTSLKPVTVQARQLFPGAGVAVEAMIGDVVSAHIEPDDVAYYDPPYTKRQYAAYYHLLETLALGDEPEVSGITGLRPWRHLASDFCYRRRALGALTELVRTCPARRVLLSYSSEGHIDGPTLQAALEEFGQLKVHAIDGFGRYRPNQAASDNSSTVTEFVFELTRSDALTGGETAA